LAAAGLAMTPDLAVSAYSALLATGSRRIDQEAVQIGKQQLVIDRLGYEASVEDLQISREAKVLAENALKLAKKDLEVARESLRIDLEQVGCARRSLEIDTEMRYLGVRSLELDRTALLTAQTDLTRQREWRLVEEKTQQLKAIGSLSALIAGFAMVVLVELSVPEDVHPALLICFAVTTGLVVCLMALTMITTSMMLVYILNYRQITDEPFKRVWQNVCERDWERSFGCFKAGVPCFLFSLCCLSWIKFSTNTNWADAVAASMVTALSLITMTLWALYVQTKYRSRTRERDFEDALEAERIMKAVDAERDILRDVQKLRQPQRKRKSSHRQTAPEDNQMVSACIQSRLYLERLMWRANCCKYCTYDLTFCLFASRMKLTAWNLQYSRKLWGRSLYRYRSSASAPIRLN